MDSSFNIKSEIKIEEYAITYHPSSILIYNDDINHKQLNIKSENKSKTWEIATFEPMIKSENFLIDKHSDNHGEIYHILMSELSNKETKSKVLPKIADYSTSYKKLLEPNECTRVDVTEKLSCKESNAKTECLTTHNLSRKCKPNHTCEVCNKAFKSPLHLKCHIRSHLGEKPFTCEICSKGFTQAYSLRIHMRFHSGEKPYTCEMCSKGFAQASDLKGHMRIHSGKKPYTCEICSKSFAHVSNLNRHARLHSGEKPYTCEICSKSFAHVSNLNRHVIIHSGEKPYTLRSHKTIRLSRKPCTCEICSKAYSSSSSLKRHSVIHSRTLHS